jgi:glucokinase
MRTVGVLVVGHVATGLVERHQVVGKVRTFPGPGDQTDALRAMHADEIAQAIAEEVRAVAGGEEPKAIGIGFPGVTREGVVQECPNLQQAKGFDLETALASALRSHGLTAPVRIFNDAAVTAAGIAATRGHLDRLIRVWTLVDGVGFGHYPWAEGVWEGGHSTVTLDPKEHFCGCGGRGHVEGIMGHHAMRLRFLDLEPEEIFANARSGEARCEEFVKFWHRALAAATANSIHMEGPGTFFITGHNARFVDLALLDRYVHEMVKMTALQGSRFEVIATGDEIGIIGAAVNAERAALRTS